MKVMNKLAKKFSKTFLLLFVLVLGGLVLPTEARASLNTDYVELKVTYNTAPSTPNIDNFYNDGAWTTDSTPTLQFDLSDPDSGDIINYQIQIDDTDDFSSPVVNYTEPSGSASPRDNVQYTPSALNDGSYYWRVKAIDDGSAESSWATANSGAIAFKVDATAPTISSPTSSDSSDYIYTNGTTVYYGDDMSSTQSFTISGSASDEGSGLNQATFTSVCLGSPSADDTPTSWSADYSDVDNVDDCTGASLITVTVSDTAGNSSTQDYAVNRDTTNPSTVADLSSSSHTASTWSIDTAIDVSWTASTDTDGSGVSAYSYLFDTTSDTTPNTTPDGTGISTTSSAQSDSNSIYFHVGTIDNVGNWGSGSNLGPFYIDSTAPTSGSLSIDSGATYAKSTSVTLGIDATDATSGLYQMIISEDSGYSGASWETYSTSKVYTLFSGNETKTVYIKFKDNADNESTSSSDTIILDATAPSGGSITYTDGYYTALSVDLTVADGTDADSGVNTSSRIVQRKSATLSAGSCGDYGDWSNISPSGTYSSFTDITVVTNKCYQYQYLVSDTAGNQVTYTSTNTAKIDNTAPTTPGTPSTATPTNDTTPTWTWTASTDSGSGLASTPYTIQWCLDSGFSGCTANTSTSSTASFTHSTALADGTWYFKVKAKDAISNESSYSSNGSVNINTSSPTGSISINSGASYTGTRSIILTISATDDSDSTSSLTMKVSNSADFSDASYETYATSKSWTLTTTDGTKTVYIKFKDSVGNESGTHSDTIALDTTAPSSFDLDSPGHESYTNSERPTFKWKAASTPDATSGLSKYSVEVDNGDSGDFIIDDIPTNRTTDYETNKYVAHYENFSDSDSTNNYISVYARSTSSGQANSWDSDNNDGKIKEGKRSWKVKAVDNVGNEREESRTLFVDRSGPSVEITQINTTSEVSLALSTADKTPTIFGKTTDSLNGNPSASSEQANKVASGPKEVEIKFEKRNYLGTYNLYALATAKIYENYWTADGSKITDNTKNTSNKYSGFSYTPTTDLPLGTYKIILVGKDKADNNGRASSFTLTIKTFEEIAKIPEMEKTIEEIGKERKVPVEEIEEMIKKQGIIVPEELKEPSKIAEAVGKTFAGIANLWWKTVDSGKFLAGKTGQGLAFVVEKTIGHQTSRLVRAWLTSRKSIIEPVSEEVQNLATKLKVATSTFVVIVFDKEPTRITDIRLEEVTPTTAVVYWLTNHYATSKVNYGFSTSYGQEVFSDKWVKEHQMVLKDLEPGKLYYFEVMSQGKNYVYDAYYTFTTPTQENEKVKGAVAGEKLATIAGDDGNWVLVRKEPSLKGEILAKVAIGQSFPLLEEKDGWVKIKLDPSISSEQVEGWVFGEFVKIEGKEKE